jgi:hypothetical protein
MSEPKGVFARIKISQQAYESWLSSPIGDVRRYDDWINIARVYELQGGFQDEWLDDVGYGKCVTKQDYFSANDDSYHYYNEEENSFNFLVLNYGENFSNYVHALSVLRDISEFKDIESNDFIAISPFMWTENFYEALICEVGIGTSGICLKLPKSLEFQEFTKIAISHVRIALEKYNSFD